MKQFILAVLLLVVASTYSSAQAFVYHPNNPNFGGNTFNYAWMLSQAQAQDRNVDPSVKKNSSTTATSTLDAYSQSLQNQLLSRITSNLVSSQFGEGTLQPGTYKFGDYQVEIRNGTDGVVVRIVDGKGGETSITVPYF